jgi:arylsulfatase
VIWKNGESDMAPARLKNLVLVSYDTTRADVAYSLGLPGVERLRKTGTTFLNCVASAPLTPVSHASIMTGLQPSRHGVRHLFKEQLNISCSTLAEVLRHSGFHTSAIVSCPGLNRWYGIDRGFMLYDDEIPRLPDGTDPLQTVDVKIRGQALKRAELVIARSRTAIEAAGDTPFFHFMHFFDAHWPYQPPSRPFTIQVKNEYEAELAYCDHFFSLWLDWMVHTGRLDDSLVVLFGDHGEDLNGWYKNDKGGDALGHPEENGHGCLLYDQTIMVPLVFSLPKLALQTFSQQVRLVDIMPSCLEMLHIDIPQDLDGRSLASAITLGAKFVDRPGYCETFYPTEQTHATGGQFSWTRNKKCVRIANQHKVIIHLESDQVEVYDLRNDPNEDRNLAEQ